MPAIDESSRKRAAPKRTADAKAVRFQDDENEDQREDRRHEGSEGDGDRDDDAREKPALLPQAGEDGTRTGGEGQDVTSDNDTLEYLAHEDPPPTHDNARRREARTKGVVAEETRRVQEWRAEQTLPKRHQHRIGNTRIDISNTGLARSDHTQGSPRTSCNATRKSRRASQVTEIYFSPIDVNRHRISFTDPIQQPEDYRTPTQERDDDERRWRAAEKQRKRDTPTTDDQPREKLMLAPEQVDRLVKALAESPLLHIHVTKQWWDETGSEVATVLSEDDVPSLSSGSAPSPTSFYSQPNHGFANGQSSPPWSSGPNDFTSEEEYPDNSESKKFASQHARPHFGGIAMIDPKVHGSPVRFMSQGYQLGANVLQVGHCTFLNIPYGATVQSNLRIEPPSAKSINCRVMLQVVNQVLERRSDSKSYLVVAELDVTDSFIKAALRELSAHSGLSLHDIDILTPGVRAKHRDDLDWSALADEIETSLFLRDIVEAAARSFAHLTAETCAMQTLTLMSELQRLKVQHQDFFVLRPTAFHPNGMMAGVSVPWISHHLATLLADDDDTARLLRERVVVAVTEGLLDRKAFDTKIWWGDRMRSVHCVPLYEGADGKMAAWTAFLSGESLFFPFRL